MSLSPVSNSRYDLISARTERPVKILFCAPGNQWKKNMTLLVIARNFQQFVHFVLHVIADLSKRIIHCPSDNPSFQFQAEDSQPKNIFLLSAWGLICDWKTCLNYCKIRKIKAIKKKVLTRLPRAIAGSKGYIHLKLPKKHIITILSVRGQKTHFLVKKKFITVK